MCLILFASDAHPRYRLVLAANRDEFYERPTAAAHWWENAPDLLAGRDLRGGGSWMGVTRGGRWAAVTNYRDLASVRADAPSRGALVSDYLRGDLPPERYLQTLARRAGDYNGFNLLVGDAGGVWWLSNHSAGPVRVEPGTERVGHRRERGLRLVRLADQLGDRADEGQRGSLIGDHEDFLSPPRTRPR